jgi:hypothetical protein
LSDGNEFNGTNLKGTERDRAERNPITPYTENPIVINRKRIPEDYRYCSATTANNYRQDNLPHYAEPPKAVGKEGKREVNGKLIPIIAPTTSTIVVIACQKK